VVWIFPWSVLASISLFEYVKTLPNYGVQPFEAATISVICLFIALYIILRTLAEFTTNKYFGLERDIVLNRLTAADIMTRYLRDLSGPDMVQWFDDTFELLDVKQDQLERKVSKAKAKAIEISAINRDYVAERKERAATPIFELRRAIVDCIAIFDILNFQTEFFIKIYRTPEEDDALKQKFGSTSERLKRFNSQAHAAFEVLTELTAISEIVRERDRLGLPPAPEH